MAKPAIRKPARRKPAAPRAKKAAPTKVRPAAPATASDENLREYRRRRDFSVTSEPAPQAPRSSSEGAGPGFVVHKHDATRLHYDLRLEMDGALASWSVPKGPSYDPAVKRLAIQTEDHPIEYGKFEGRIPDGEYGAGDSLIWDRGRFDTVPPGQASAMRRKGHLVFELRGDKLRGQWHLVRTHGAPGRGNDKQQWLLFKAKDGTEDPALDIVVSRPESVVSGRVATRGPARAKDLRAPHAAPDKLLGPLLPPMLATLVDAPPEPESDWHAEMKIDGYRALCAVAGGRVAMWTRNGLDLTGRFPGVARALGKLVVGDAILDGEVALLDAQGAPRFELIQQGHTDEAIFFAFDLLRLENEDLRARPLEERRDLLGSLLANAPPQLRVIEELPLPLTSALAGAAARGYEGLVLKRRGSTWEKGRSRDWLKLKVLSAQELAIVGWMPGEGSAARQVGSLLLGVAQDGALHFAGKVGTGFSAKQRAELRQLLEPDAVDKPEVQGAPRLRQAHWVTPRHVAQVRFTEWTADGKLRHPAFQGLRPDKTPLECVRERPAAAPVAGAKAKGKKAAPGQPMVAAAKKSGPPAGGALPPLTNPQRVLYPADGITKADLAAYYEAVEAPLLRALAGRPLALVHWNQGVGKPSWFQQNIGDEAEPWMTLAGTHTQKSQRVVRHLVADSPRALRWLAQHSVLELHAWHSREGSLSMPDWVVFDLDPGEGQGIEQAIEVAQLLHEMFDRLGLPSVPKTTGKRGLHVLVPLAPGHTYADAESFALSVGEAVEKQVPTVTLERSLSKRRGRLYFDCLQNAQGKTIVSAYSPRGADGAPVSAPLRWSEVVRGLDPARFNVKTMPARLASVGDLFEPALTQGVRLPRGRK